ncbi:short-chain dehydrogenase/reductase family protein [Nitzschia inconspicua]|uniref:Short-chain dehydrogenase/reductase family protein n=1 Tax=Nitzschia inconspicua TaxID=303405 RepID=A0A9K3PEP9_9STRA|nr:short-chain dehydrogenase/reductase family protein [Nitzschia inconspicua]
MISKMLKLGAVLVALVSIWLGMCFYTTIPVKMGFYRFLSTLNPVLIGIMPIFLEGVPWGYTWEEYYSPETLQLLKGQRAIVTGGNSGIGFDLAMALFNNGVDVTITCRSELKCATAKQAIEAEGGLNKGRLFTMLMDTSSFASVRSFCENYVTTFSDHPIDMLFFNAGTNFIKLKNPEDNPDCAPKTAADGIDYLFQVNYLSHHLMYRLLEPFLAPNARIVHTSSASAFSTFSYKVATDLETLHGCSEPYLKSFTMENLSYGQSKLAQDLWCKALTRKLGLVNSNISANAFHPGLVNTAIFEKITAVSDIPNQAFMQDTIIPKYAWQSPDGALTGLFLATHFDSRGKYYHPQAIEVVNELAVDESLQDKLWDFSEELVQDYLTPIRGSVKAENEVAE